MITLNNGLKPTSGGLRLGGWVPRSALPTVRFANPTDLANASCDKHSPTSRSSRIRVGVHSIRGA